MLVLSERTLSLFVLLILVNKDLEHMKKKIGELIFQIIPVMIGVFLGLSVANWSEDRKKETRSDALVETIKNEIQSNKKFLKAFYRIMKC